VIIAVDKKFSDKMNVMGMFLLFMSFLSIEHIGAVSGEVHLMPSFGNTSVFFSDNKDKVVTLLDFAPLFSYDPSMPLDDRIFRFSKLAASSNDNVQKSPGYGSNLRCNTLSYLGNVGKDGPIPR